MGKSKELAELGQVVSQSGGNVGIGTSVPEYALHLKGSYPYIAFEDTDSGSTSQHTITGNSDGNMYFDSVINNASGNSGFRFRHNSASITSLAIDASGRVTMPYQPSVGGRRLNPKNGANAYVVTGVNLTLIDIYANTGNAWNNTTGIFLCPVAGKYLVQANLLQDDAAGSSTLCRASFRINGVETYMGYDNSRTGTGYDGMVSFGGVLSCQANDQISIQVTSGTIHWSNESAFSIALIG